MSVDKGPITRTRAREHTDCLKESLFPSVFEICPTKRRVQPRLSTPCPRGSGLHTTFPPVQIPVAFPPPSHALGDCASTCNGFYPDINVAGGSGAQSVTQPDRHVLVSEGAPLQLRCSYSSSVPPSLFWYQQRPSQGLQLLLKYMSGATLVTGINGFQAELRKNETSFHLRKPSAHWSDSAEYFCVLGDRVSGAAGGAEHKPPDTGDFL
ncbi:hypothetical protein GHT09_001741 [Marmota monax]|uniref:Ig-like domain-containing protein n=1 Tax=Marmota monax TaxID=9995 RepID=A0A834PW37_MARMO|nr:hypothetical protein GHT09_001741 [Marmota monax]